MQKKKKILVIDDSEVNLYLLEAIFDNDPEIEVILENDSTKALAHLRKGLPHLLVIDLMMPNIDGFQLLHQIKADPGFADLPIVVISARHDKAAIDEVMQYEVQEYIKKPINMQDVEQRVRKLLEMDSLVQG